MSAKFLQRKAPPPPLLPEPSLRQKGFLETYPITHVFAVVSWGCAATSWLATVLNSHPAMFCVHASNQFWSTWGRAPHLDGAEYLRLLGCQGSNYAAAGDVHGVSLHCVPQIRACFGGSCSVAVLVRDPLPRLRSQLALFKRLEYTKGWSTEHLDAEIATLKMLPDDSYSTRLFVHGAKMLNSVIRESETAPIFRSEDITSSAESLASLTDLLTGGNVRPDPEWLERCLQLRAMNTHRPSAESVPQPFLPWQIEAIRELVLPDAWDCYKKLGYRTPDFI